MRYDELDDILDGIDEAQLLRDIGEDELARQADMFEQLQKKEAVVEGGQLVRGQPQPAPGTPHPSHTATPHTHSGTPRRKHSSSTLADPGPLGKFFEPGAEAGLAADAAEHRSDQGQEQDSQDSQDEEPFDCAAEVSCPDG